jgi:GTP-binding protein
VLSIQIVDSRHDPSKLDLQLREWLTTYGKPHLTVATKSDKLSQNELRKNIGRAREILGAAAASGGEVVAYSAVTGHGRERVWRAVEEAITVSHSPS